MMSGVRELVGAEVLVIDKDPSVQKGMTQLLASASLHVTCVGSLDEAEEHMKRRFYCVVIVDLDTPRPGDGLDTTARIKELSPTSMVVMLTPRKSFDDAISSLRAGAVDLIWKAPESVKYLKDRVLEAAGRSVGKREVNSILIDVRDTYDEFLKAFMGAERRCVDLEDQLAGRDVDAALGTEIRVVVIDSDPGLANELASSAPSSFHFETLQTGGEALDRCSSGGFNIAMVASSLPDLPSSMVVRSIKTQVPEMMVLHYAPLGTGGKVEIVETTRNISVLDSFDEAAQLVARLDELAEAFRAKARERRYTQSFRERHYDFLRRFVELKMKIDRSLTGDNG